MIAAQPACFYPRASSRGEHQSAYVVDCVLFGAGLFFLAESSCKADCGGPDLVFGGGPIAAGALGALVNLAIAGDGTVASPPMPPVPVEDLVHDALESASAGDCAAVRAAIARLVQRDPAHAGALDAEPAIAACLR